MAALGFEHKSHQSWGERKSSIERTRALIKRQMPGQRVAFRPLYGQRTPDTVTEVASDGKAPVVLWSIDSQDWRLARGHRSQ